IGVDTWGVDYALLDERGELLENPHHYRDRRTDNALQAVFHKIPRDRIYATTGIQLLPLNTLFQLSTEPPDVVARAASLATIPDLLNYWLTGNLQTEYTIASTTQLLDVRTRSWAWPLIDELGFPQRLFQPIIQPGTLTGRYNGIPVIAPACHDTASAVAAI